MHWCPCDDIDIDNDKDIHKDTHRRNLLQEGNDIYGHTFSVLQKMYLDKQEYGITFENHKSENKDKDKDRDKITKIPNMCFILENDMTQEYQIWWGEVSDYAQTVMHRRWCTGGDAPQVMHYRWCTAGDGLQVMHRRDAVDNFDKYW